MCSLVKVVSHMEQTLQQTYIAKTQLRCSILVCRLWEGLYTLYSLQSYEYLPVTVLFIHTGYLYLPMAAVYTLQFTFAISAEPHISQSKLSFD